MPGQFEKYADDMGWTVGTANVLVEGTSDVAYLRLARKLWLEEKGHDLFADGFAVFEAGRKGDGGVQGVVRQLQTLRQLADRDVSNRMANRRIVGLFDNDRAGQDHIDLICKIDFHIKRYRDVFLLHPTMPLSNGVLGLDLQRQTERQNQSCLGLGLLKATLAVEKSFF